MNDKNGTEVKEIFCWSQQNYKSVLDVLGKERFKEGEGGGKTYTFNEMDMNDLLDIKIYQLAGTENPKIKNLLNPGDDFEEIINNQIRQHEKNILMLNFLRDIRTDIYEYAKLSPEQVINVNEKSAQVSKLPAYGSPEYYDVMWDFIELVFIIDYLTSDKSHEIKSCKDKSRENKSRERKKKENNKKILAAISILEKIITMQGNSIKHGDVTNALLELSTPPMVDDQDIKASVKEVLSQYEDQKNEILNFFKKSQIDPVTDQTDAQTGAAYRNMALHFYQFVIDYFVGEKELNNLLLCIRDFSMSLDQEKLKVGVIKIKS